MWLASVYLLCWLAGSARAQSVPTTSAVCLADFAWAFNDQDQSPCLLAAYLQGACGSGYWNVPALPLGNRYDPPRANQTNPCMCSSVTYSAVSACGACQGSNWVTWPAWKVNCAAEHVRVSAYTVEIPKNTSVPQWAYVDPNTSLSSSFNATAARQVAAQGSPDITVANSTVASSSTVLSSSTISSSTSSSSPSQTPAQRGQGPNAGLIAGATIGSVAVLTLIIALIFVALRMRRSSRASAAPSSQYIHKWSKNVGQGGPSSWGGSVVGGDVDTTTSMSATPMMARGSPATVMFSNSNQTMLSQSSQGPVLQHHSDQSPPTKRKPGSHNQNVITPFILPPPSHSSSLSHITGEAPHQRLVALTPGSPRLIQGLTNNGNPLAPPSYTPPSLPIPPYATVLVYEHGLTSNGYPDEKRRARPAVSSTVMSAPDAQLPNPIPFQTPRLYNPDDPTTYPQTMDDANIMILNSPSTGTLSSSVNNPLSIPGPRTSIGHGVRGTSTESGNFYERSPPPSAWDGRGLVMTPPPTSVTTSPNVHASQSASSPDAPHRPARQSRSSSSTSMSSFPLLSGHAKHRQNSRDGSISWSPNTKQDARNEPEFDPWKLTPGS